MTAIAKFNVASAAIKRSSPPWAHHLLRKVWHWFVLPPLRLGARIRELAGRDYSAAPPLHVRVQYDTLTQDAYLNGDEAKYRVIADQLGACGIAVGPMRRVLDFGCGIASALSAFRRHIPEAELYGCDIKKDPIDWVSKHRRELTVARNGPMPPLPPEFDNFDLIYAISVWTHMPEPACAAWIHYLHERLRPGGILFFTLVEPSTDFVRRHGFEPASLAPKVSANGGCLHDSYVDMTYIQVEWIERQIEGKFALRYFGPTDYVQWGAVLERLDS